MTAATHARTAPAAPAPAAPRPSTLTGTGRLLRLALRRDRVRIPVWVVSIAGMVGYFAVAIPVAYPDAAARQTRAAIMRDPSGALLSGPGYGLDDYTMGAMVTNEMLGMLAVAAALMSAFLVVRHTRAEEEIGRTDLVRSGVVGRHAPLAAGVLDALVANAAVALALVGALVGTGLAVDGSVAVALGVAGVGIVFTGVAAVTAQVASTARAATGSAGALVGLAFLLRGVGDAQQTGGSALSWASPIGWAQQTRAFVDLRWWPLALHALLAALLLVGAWALVGRRDVGAGLLTVRPGRGAAAAWLRTPLGLTARLERTATISWAAGLGVFGLLTGAMSPGIVDSFAAQPELATVFGASGDDLLRGTLSAFLGFFAMAVAVFAVVTVHRLGREESSGRAAVVLASAVGRPRWLLAHVGVALGGGTVLLLVCGVTLGAGAAGSVGDAGLVVDLTLAALVHLPTVALFTALAAAVHGAALPSWTTWAVLVASIVVGLYGPLLGLPSAVLDAAPFGLVPALPAEAFDLAPVLGVSAGAAVLLGVGLALHRRRDLRA